MKTLVIDGYEGEVYEGDKTKCRQLRLICKETGKTIGFLTPMKGLCVQLSPDLKASKALARAYGDRKLQHTDPYTMITLIEKCVKNFMNNVYGKEYTSFEPPCERYELYDICSTWKEWSWVHGY